MCIPADSHHKHGAKKQILKAKRLATNKRKERRKVGRQKHSTFYATPKVTKHQRCNFIIQIHKFNIMIDTISIILLFECVKIVEFNFISDVFLVMYQEIVFVNQDVSFLNQEERRQFLIILFPQGTETRTQVGIQDGF